MTLWQKILFVTCVPLVCYGTLIVGVGRMISELEKETAAQTRLRTILSEADRLKTLPEEISSSLSFYTSTSDPEFRFRGERTISVMKGNAADLTALLPDDEEKQLGRKLESAAADLELAFLRGTRERPQKATGPSVMQQTQMKLAIQAYESSLNEIIRRAESTPNREKELRNKLHAAIAFGALSNAALAAVLGTWLAVSLRRRLLKLKDNCRRLQEGLQPEDTLPGSDELAFVDRVLHEMHGKLDSVLKSERESIASAIDVSCALDSEGRFLSISSSSKTVWGYETEELTGRYAMEMAASSQVDATMKELKEIIARKGRGSFENQITRKDGSKIDMLWSAHWSENRQVLFCVAQDITEQKRAGDEPAYEEKPIPNSQAHPSQSAAAKLGPILNASQRDQDAES